jgi:hypothetical protein
MKTFRPCALETKLFRSLCLSITRTGVTGDFNGDGATDFAVVVIKEHAEHEFTLLVFNGPLDQKRPLPAFVDAHSDLTKTDGLFYGPPRPKPYRLVLGPFESE